MSLPNLSRLVRAAPRIIALGAACTLLAGLSVSSAAAQDTEIGSRVNKRRPLTTTSQSERKAIFLWHTYTRCMTDKRTASVRRLLDATTDAEVAQLGPALTREVQCVLPGPDTVTSWSLNAPFAIQRGMYAEALLGKMRHPLGLAALPRERLYHSPWSSVSGRAAAVDEMAMCVAATNPSGIEALMATEADSREELAAFGTIAPSFGPCLAVNVQLNANRLGVRAALAEALYHRATAPDEPAATAPAAAPPK